MLKLCVLVLVASVLYVQLGEAVSPFFRFLGSEKTERE
jgi:hypothetical protein